MSQKNKNKRHQAARLFTDSSSTQQYTQQMLCSLTLKFGVSLKVWEQDNMESVVAQDGGHAALRQVS